MSKENKVSVIVPVYNVERYLEDCLKSILSQTYQNLEIILVNDGSTDNSGTICDDYESKQSNIKVIHKSNEGVNYARRDGFQASTGELIVFLDSDDIISPDFIKNHLEMLERTSADITVGKVHSFYGEFLSQGEIEQCSVKSSNLDYMAWRNKHDILSAFITSSPPYSNMALMSLWSKLYKRKVIETVNWEIANYKHGEDYFINLQTYNKANSVCFINKYCYYYRRSRQGKLTQSTQYNISPSGKKISNLEYVDELIKMYKHLSYKEKLDLDKEIIISQCRLYTYWLDKLIDMKILDIDLWKKHIVNKLIPLILEFKTKDIKNYTREKLTYGEKLHKDLWAKLTPIYKNQKIEKYLQYKISLLNSVTNKPQNYIDYTDAWVVMDRPESSTDNGYHFYKWMKKHHPSKNIFYVINNDSKDVPHLKSENFNLVFTNTEQHKELLNNCIVEIYAYYTFNLCKERTVFNSLKVYLSHGIKLNNSLNPGLCKNDLFVTTFKREFDFFTKNHKDFKTIQTGLPRLKNLIKKSKVPKDHIIIAPQWRRWLKKKVTRDNNYFTQWSNLINSEVLKSLSQKYKIVFIIHPELETKFDLLNIPKYMKIKRYSDLGAIKLQNLMKKTILMITDFSSVAVDYAIAGSDIVYFQFDRNKYYKNHTVRKGWFDYDLDGFGPVFFKSKDLIAYLSKLDENNFNSNEKYKKRLHELIDSDLQMLKSPSENIYKQIINNLKSQNTAKKP